MSDVFDEQLSLKRLGVALKRDDWRMFEQALEKLAAEVASGYPFQRHQDWQEFLKLASAHEELPAHLKDRLREALTRLMSVEVSVPASNGAADPEAESIAIVLGWRSTLQDPAAMAAFKAWLTPKDADWASSAARSLLSRWLEDPRVGLETLVNRANLTLAAAYGGVATTDPHWVDTFLAGLRHVLASASLTPPLPRLFEAIAPLGPASLLTVEPSLVWERHFGASRFHSDAATPAPAGALPLVKLTGSLDWFYCHSCFHLAAGAPEGPSPLAVACPSCAAPAWPLVMPVDHSPIMPPAIRNVWAWGGELLREAGTWVLVDPPAPESGSFQRWLFASLSSEKRVLVVGSEDAVRAAWRAELEGRGVTVVTSHGPADEVLGFLLQGGVPELKAPRPPVAAAKKKGKR